ncbi:MAG: molybdopterin-synthase adenylyltransferase MoeB [Armatimonadota bacterium]|nr:molybdopterin-synthase adenylyltransferase MoeB [Armatimonadota bacterium]MDR7444197.1 molybdopterin-synthase adenylyltransferase MoeB [Armatimonadota bacterium]MDR7570593.1 molybdopterin-synthase adenylyltransferase MoeB [Armatimonadota bacterium]MDR7614268.1 molybdopterin-synthase adenylyltransferase MoeB [Armatimonadota bacterium]
MIQAQPLLTEEQMQRYSRQIVLPEVGVTGQRRLLDSSVLIVGAGGLGSPAALYLAAAGVGTIGIVDGDRVDLTNLQRQILHFTHDVGRPKTQSARRTLEDINPDVRVVTYQTVLTSENALEILRPYDVVVNGSDNFPTRYLVNDACVMLGKPLVDASILRWEGQATTYLPGRGCYRCLFPSPPPPGAVPSCAEGGIIGAVAGFLGSYQALEAIKILLGVGATLVNRLMLVDVLEGDIRYVRWQRNPRCPVCGDEPTIRTLIDYEEFCGVPLPGRDLHQAERKPEVTVAQASEWLGRAQFVDVREAWEVAQAHIPGMHWIPMGEVETRYGEIARDRPVVVYCASGQRSGKVTEWLRARGYDNVYNLAGGILAWQNAQQPVATGLPERVEAGRTR